MAFYVPKFFEYRYEKFTYQLTKPVNCTRYVQEHPDIIPASEAEFELVSCLSMSPICESGSQICLMVFVKNIDIFIDLICLFFQFCHLINLFGSLVWVWTILSG